MQHVRRLIFSLLVVSSLIACAGRRSMDALGVKPQTLTAEEWASLSKPGSFHHMLDMFVGEWDVVIKSWKGPEAHSEQSSGRSFSSWTLGYRFVREKFVSLEKGPRFEGLGFFGYDMASRLFTAVWMDSLNTSISTSKGIFNTESSTFELVGEVYDPRLGRTKETQTLIRVISPDSYEVSMIDQTERGQSFKSLEIVYHRIPSADAADHNKHFAPKPKS